MVRRHFLRMLSLVLSCACGALLAIPSHADEPAGVVRYFLEVPHIADGLHDWEAPESRRIIVGSEKQLDFSPEPVQFATPNFSTLFPDQFQVVDADGNLLLDLAGTTWVPMPVLQITDDSLEEVKWVYWLATETDGAPKLTGAMAETGPDGDVLVLADVGLNTVSEMYYLGPSDYPVRISVGYFQK